MYVRVCVWIPLVVVPSPGFNSYFVKLWLPILIPLVFSSSSFSSYKYLRLKPKVISLLPVFFFYFSPSSRVKIAGDNPSPPIRGPPPAPFLLPLMLFFLSFFFGPTVSWRKEEKRLISRQRVKRSHPFKSDRGGFRSQTAPLWIEEERNRNKIYIQVHRAMLKKKENRRRIFQTISSSQNVTTWRLLLFPLTFFFGHHSSTDISRIRSEITAMSPATALLSEGEPPHWPLQRRRCVAPSLRQMYFWKREKVGNYSCPSGRHATHSLIDLSPSAEPLTQEQNKAGRHRTNTNGATDGDTAFEIRRLTPILSSIKIPFLPISYRSLQL